MIRSALIRLRQTRRRGCLEDRRAEPAGVATSAGDPWTAIDLERAVARLPESLRAVLVLKQWEGMSHDAIATHLGISSGASRVRYLRALRQLRRLLEPEN